MNTKTVTYLYFVTEVLLFITNCTMYKVYEITSDIYYYNSCKLSGLLMFLLHVSYCIYYRKERARD